MKIKSLVICAVAGITIISCDGNPGKTASPDVAAKDSCALALPFENAAMAESLVAADYTGNVNNYRGDDTTKLDIRHVFKNGKLIKSYFYYENGQVQEEYAFKCGALHGVQKWYFENGNLARLIPYRYGYRNGTGKLYDEAGKLVEHVIFRNDTLVK